MKKSNKLYKFLLYVTNNEEKSRDEEKWDIVFFIFIIIALLGGTAVFIIKHQPEWISVLIIETIWCIDNLRNNRE